MDSAQIVTEIRNRVGSNSGLSDQTITSLVSSIIPQGGEVGEDFFNSTANWLKTLGGNFSHDVAAQVKSQLEAKVAEGVEAFKKTYKPEVKTIEDVFKMLGVEKPSEQAPKTIDELIAKLQTPQQAPTDNNQMLAELMKIVKEGQKPDPEIAALKQQLSDLIAENKRIKEQNGFEQIVGAVKGKADSLMVLDSALWEHAIDCVTLANDRNGLTEDKLLELTKSKYEELSKALRPAGTKIYGESRTNGENPILKSILDKKNAEQKARAEAVKAQQSRWK